MKKIITYLALSIFSIDCIYANQTLKDICEYKILYENEFTNYISSKYIEFFSLRGDLVEILNKDNSIMSLYGHASENKNLTFNLYAKVLPVNVKLNVRGYSSFDIESDYELDFYARIKNLSCRLMFNKGKVDIINSDNNLTAITIEKNGEGHPVITTRCSNEDNNKCNQYDKLYFPSKYEFRISPNEITRIKNQLNKIDNYVDEIKKIDIRELVNEYDPDVYCNSILVENIAINYTNLSFALGRPIKIKNKNFRFKMENEERLKNIKQTNYGELKISLKSERESNEAFYLGGRSNVERTYELIINSEGRINGLKCKMRFFEGFMDYDYLNYKKELRETVHLEVSKNSNLLKKYIDENVIENISNSEQKLYYPKNIEFFLSKEELDKIKKDLE